MHNDTGMGKRSALLDLARSVDREAFEDLLARADVVVTGYRPGALDRFGLSAEALARAPPRPGGRRAVGVGPVRPVGRAARLRQPGAGGHRIALHEGSSLRPGALPAQALDHGTGYLLAAAVLRALTERHLDGGTWVVRAALARTAHWLQHELDAAPPAGGGGRTVRPGTLARGARRSAGAAALRPLPVRYEGGPSDWARAGPAGGAPTWPAGRPAAGGRAAPALPPFRCRRGPPSRGRHAATAAPAG